jgi:hypothetical protein
MIIDMFSILMLIPTEMKGSLHGVHSTKVAFLDRAAIWAACDDADIAPDSDFGC